MRRVIISVMATVIPIPASADVTGFAQMRQTQRLHSLDDCNPVAGCTTMVQEIRAELLIEQHLTNQFAATARLEGLYDHAVSDEKAVVREAFIDWAPASALNIKLGRQVLTWGVSDYLYVNDIFPKNYDAFFTGAGFDRIKEPVDAASVIGHAGGVDLEMVISKSKADISPSALRFTALKMSTRAISVEDADDRADVAAKLSTNVGGWDMAAYAASFRARDQRYFMDAIGLRYDRPRTHHLGVSFTGNFATGLAWAEAALRDTSQEQNSVVSRHFIGSAAKFIAGYSREIGADLTALAQMQIEAPLEHADYADSLATEVRPLKRVASTLHLQLQAHWLNQTLSAGTQLFAGNEHDTHLNPFMRWSPADGWVIEGGVNLFNGKSYTRYGAFKDDSNAYTLVRHSF